MSPSCARRTPRSCATLRVGRSPSSNRSAATQISRMPGSSWAWPNSQGATEERNSWRSKRVANTRSRPATRDARSRPGTRSVARCSSGGLPSTRCSPSSTRSSPGRRSAAWPRSRPTRSWEARTCMRASAASKKRATGSSARSRSAASGIAYGLAEAHSAGAGMEMLAGDADAAERELRDAIGVATDMGASRYVALYRTKLARVLVEQGPERGCIRRTGAGKGHLRRSRVEGCRRTPTRAARGDRGGRRARARGDRVHGGQRQHHGARGDPGRLRRGAPGARRPRRCRRGARRGGGPPRRRATSCPPGAAASFWRQSQQKGRQRRRGDRFSRSGIPASSSRR